MNEQVRALRDEIERLLKENDYDWIGKPAAEWAYRKVLSFIDDQLEGISQKFPLIPQWKWAEPGCDYPPCLTRCKDEDGDLGYAILSGRLLGTIQYISLANLENLPDETSAMKYKESLHVPETCKENGDSFTDEVISFWNKATGFQPKFAIMELKRDGFAKVAKHFYDLGKEETNNLNK